MPRETYTRTGNEVALDVKRIFGDEALVELKGSDLLRWMNAAQREIASSNQVIKGSASTDLIAGQTLYTLPSNSPVYQIQGIQVEGKPLKAVSFQTAQEMINSSDPAQESKGAPNIWYEWDNDLYISPASETTVTNGITIYYIAYPAGLTSLTSTLEVPDRFYNQVVDYVLAQAYRLDENWQATAYQDQRFRESMNRHLVNEMVTDVSYYGSKTVLPEDE